MIQFESLSLSGFKSFVDKTVLDIPIGLTGVVGPNGCGKSNLVEALRWAMGESSAKRMRGGDMDDVIFNGTSSRPARNFAEVIMTLNNGMHTAPAPYTPFDQIEISRKIERGSGSTYRINGKVARARDVQLLLADTMTGASSPALVSQGKLTQIISAKPFDRRQILEESAGITGLHARRHEAELRLQAADNNLIRLQDSLGSLETQLASLKRQSRQAEKYRILTDEIKALETQIAALEWIKITRAKQEIEAQAIRAEQEVAEGLVTASSLEREVTDASAGLQPLRQTAAESAARHQAVQIELRQLDHEEQQLEQAIRDLQSQLVQCEQDLHHDAQMIDESHHLIAALEQEEQTLRAEEESTKDRLPILEQARLDAEEKVQKLELGLQEKTQLLASSQAQRQAILSQIQAETNRKTSGTGRIETLRARLSELKGGMTEEEQAALNTQIETLDQALSEYAQTLTRIQAEIKSLDDTLVSYRTADADARNALTQLETEQKTYKAFLDSDMSANVRPVVDDINADTGFEEAVAKAFGDTLLGTTDENGSMIWRSADSLIPAPSFPAPALPLSEKVKVPAVLTRAISYIGYVQDKTNGDIAAKNLVPGQIIVSLDGYFWRWDGLFVKPSSQDRQALLLEYKNKLAAINEQIPAARDKCDKAHQSLISAQTALQSEKTKEQETQTAQRQTQSQLNTARQDFQRKMQEAQHTLTERARLSELIDVTIEDVAEREKSLNDLNAQLAQYPDPIQSGLSVDVTNLREQTLSAQNELRTATLSVDRHLQEESRRRARLHGIADERISLQNRRARAEEHLSQINERKGQITEKLDTLLEKPAYIAEKKAGLLSRTSELEGLRARDADALQALENDIAQKSRALKEIETALNTARENRASAQTRLSMTDAQVQELDQSIQQQFSMSPHDVVMNAELSFNIDIEKLATLDPKRARREKCLRDRDAIGPVNLRADVEAQEIEAAVGKILTERDDLTAAISELRQAIDKINHEARTRLQEAFDKINTHFKTLFTRLFRGGQAHLELISTDDPLGSGLEIYAQPPGKSLQSISLLSGGEQSLTAAALIFAMFLTNPSPICVLDEIDAPLDDANVDRICDLLRDITDTCKTRFLVVTHHRLTMARMDRLYGVTMSEKGVSQLVSVDMNQQMDMLEAAA